MNISLIEILHSKITKRHKKHILLAGVVLLIFCLIANSCSFKGKFKIREWILTRSSELVFTFDEMKIVIPVDDLDISIPKTSGQKLSKKEIDSLKAEISHYGSRILRDKKNLEKKNSNYTEEDIKPELEIINNYFDGSVRSRSSYGDRFTFCTNNENQVVFLSLNFDNNMHESFYFHKNALVANSRRIQTPYSTYWVGFEPHGDWKIKSSLSYFKNNRMVEYNFDVDYPSKRGKRNKDRHRKRHNNLGILSKQQLETAFFFKAIAEYLVEHESINCRKREASYQDGVDGFMKDFSEYFDKELLDSLLTEKVEFNDEAHLEIDFLGNVLNVRIPSASIDEYYKQRRIPAKLQHDNRIAEELERVLLLTKWIPASKKCSPISSEKTLGFSFRERERRRYPPNPKQKYVIGDYFWGFHFNPIYFTGQKSY
ncbi:MAG: hypothetical protein K9H64_15830 [Bacteroidales bacterium]|nr:hypothetical protein [Bacteroidales bacterium]MCF8457438.1 hypothetical protein [Bacteroidales bacterium]